MGIDRRQFARLSVATGASALGVGWAQACAEVQETGEVSAETVLTLLDAQGPRGIYGEPEELARLQAAVTNLVNVQEQLRSFPLSDDEQPATVLRRDQ